MAIKIGFVLVTHNKSHQAIRLVNTLNSMFDRPPIAWHHDFTFCDHPLDSIPTNVSLVLPHLTTGWARFSVIEAELRAFKILADSRISPDWFVVLSGADYPIKSAEKIINDLSASRFDAHIQHDEICFNDYKSDSDWRRECFDRYFAVRVPSITRRLRPTKRIIRLPDTVLTTWLTPFSRDFPCFYGEHWLRK